MASTMTPTQIAAKWGRNLGGSTQTIKDGVNAVTESPGVKAAAAVDSYLAGVQKAVQDGSYVAGQLSYGLVKWKKAVLEKGLNSLQSGITAGMSAVVAFQTQLAPVAASIKSQVAAMPKGTVEQGIARSNFVIREMAKFRYQKPVGV